MKTHSRGLSSLPEWLIVVLLVAGAVGFSVSVGTCFVFRSGYGVPLDWKCPVCGDKNTTRKHNSTGDGWITVCEKCGRPVD